MEKRRGASAFVVQSAPQTNASPSSSSQGKRERKPFDDPCIPSLGYSETSSTAHKRPTRKFPPLRLGECVTHTFARRDQYARLARRNRQIDCSRLFGIPNLLDLIGLN